MKLLLRLGTGEPGAGYGVVVETYRKDRSLEFDSEVEVVGQRYDGVEGFNLKRGERFPLSKLIRMMIEESHKFPDTVSKFEIDWIKGTEEEHVLLMMGDEYGN